MNKTRKVEDIVSYYGKGVTPKYVDNSSIIVLNQKCIRNNSIDYEFSRYIDDSKEYNKEKLLRKGDVLINSTGVGTAGRVALVTGIPKNKQVIVDSHILVLRTDNYYESACLNYALYAKETLLQTFIDGSTGQGEFDRVKLFNIEIGFPDDYNAQQKIAGVLSALDDKIELNRKENAELEQMARTLYDYWFVQFDFPDAHGKPYKSSGGAMKNSPELNRPIPTDWEVKNLLDIVEWIGGAQPPKSTYRSEPAEGYVRFIQNRDYANNANLTYIPIRKSNKTCDEMDIMMDKYGDAGLTRYGLAGAYNVALARIKVNLDFGQEFVRKFLESEPIYQYLNNACMASTRASMNEEILGNLNVAVPPVGSELLKRFEKEQKIIIEKILANRQQSQNLANLRDWLLPVLMNGQVSVG